MAAGAAGSAAKTRLASRTFFDTNVLVYLFDADSPDKQARARQALQQALEPGAVVVSTQVLQEFFVTVTRKLARPLPAAEAERALRRLMELPVVQVDPELILAAAVSGRPDRISFWDALILAAAATAGCEQVLSEDLQHERSFGRLRIVNPFREQARGRRGSGFRRHQRRRRARTVRAQAAHGDRILGRMARRDAVQSPHSSCPGLEHPSGSRPTHGRTIDSR